MNISLKKLIPVAFLLIAGCRTTQSGSDGGIGGELPDGVSNVVEQPKTAVSLSNNFTGEHRVADSRMSISFRDTGIERITIADGSADIRDIQAFAITAYRKLLKSKLQNGTPLTKGEADVLRFICFVQHIALANFTEYGYLRLTGRIANPPKAIVEDVKNKQGVADNSEMRLLEQSVANFNSNSNVLARLIDRWAGETQRDDANDIFAEIVSPRYGRKKDSAFVARPEEFFMVANPLLLGLYVNAIDDENAIKNQDGEYTGFEYMLIFNPQSNQNLNNKQKALLWGRVADSLRFYSGDCGELHRDMAVCIQKTSDSWTKREIEDLRIEYSQWLEDDFYKFREVYYAYPFICECRKLDERIQEARHTMWVNNKNQMEDATMMFCEATSINGNAMIRNLNSRYAAKVYADTIKELKKRVGKRKFKEIQEKCRLWDLDEPEFDIDDDIFGLRKVKYMTKEGN